MEARAIASDAPELVAALEDAHLPTEDLGDAGRAFFAFEEAGRPIGFAGLELYGEDALLRSVVVLPEVRGKGHGHAVTETVLSRAREAGAQRVYLLTTTAEEFFEHEGFIRIERSKAPPSILATRQASTICASAALLMRSLERHG